MDEFNTVDTEMEQESVQADAVQASDSEETNGVMSISAILSGETEASEGSATEETQDVETQQEGQNEEKVNSGIKGRLMAEHNKGYKAGLTEAQKQWEAKEAEYKATIERLQGYELKEKAAQIAKEQNVSEAIAMFLAKNGFGDEGVAETKPETKTPMRDAATGRFVSSKETASDPSMERAKFLHEQAMNINRMSGVDVIEMLKSADNDTKAKIESGEMDLYDFYRDNSGSKSTQKKSPPNIKTNSAGASMVNMKSMSDADLDKIDAYLRNGGVIDTRM